MSYAQSLIEQCLRESYDEDPGFWRDRISDYKAYWKDMIREITTSLRSEHQFEYAYPELNNISEELDKRIRVLENNVYEKHIKSDVSSFNGYMHGRLSRIVSRYKLDKSFYKELSNYHKI